MKVNGRVLHFCGHMADRPGGAPRWHGREEAAVAADIAAVLAEEEIALGVGALASGADLLIAEALLARGAALEAVLPFAAEAFLETSVGAAWTTRFHRARAAARACHVLPQPADGQEGRYAWGTRVAVGLALLLAEGSEVVQLALWDGRPAGGAAGTAADLAAGRAAGLRQRVLPLGGPPAPLPAPQAALAGARQPVFRLHLGAGPPRSLPEVAAALGLLRPGAVLDATLPPSPSRPLAGDPAEPLATLPAAAYLAYLGQGHRVGPRRPAGLYGLRPARDEEDAWPRS